MIRFCAAWLSVAILAGVAGTAHAESRADALAPTTMTITPSYASLGIVIKSTGDENRNAVGKLAWRAVGESKWHTGHYPLRIRRDRWATSVFFLTEAREYEVRVTFTDPDGVTRQPSPQKVHTLDSRFPVGGGKTYYANPTAPAGGDGSKCARRLYSESVHCLADDVFAKYRSEPRLAITAARVRRAA